MFPRSDDDADADADQDPGPLKRRKRQEKTWEERKAYIPEFPLPVLISMFMFVMKRVEENGTFETHWDTLARDFAVHQWPKNDSQRTEWPGLKGHTIANKLLQCLPKKWRSGQPLKRWDDFNFLLLHGFCYRGWFFNVKIRGTPDSRSNLMNEETYRWFTTPGRFMHCATTCLNDKSFFQSDSRDELASYEAWMREMAGDAKKPQDVLESQLESLLHDLYVSGGSDVSAIAIKVLAQCQGADAFEWCAKQREKYAALASHSAPAGQLHALACQVEQRIFDHTCE